MKENWELAYEDYKAKMKYKDIAEKYGVSINTVKSWKSRKWNAMEDTKEVQPKKVRTQKRKGTHANKSVQPVIKNKNLTEQQQLFCLYYLQHFNQTKAYMQAYNCDYKTANANAYLLMVNHGVKEELTRLKAEMQQDIYIDAKDILSEYVKQAYADVTDFLEFRLIEEPMRDKFGQVVIDNETGEPVMKRKNIVEFKDSEEVDGTLIQEVKMGKDGASLKLMDKQRALDALMKYVDVDALKQAQLEKAQAEAVIAQDKANKLSADGKAFDLLESLYDVMQGGDGSGERK